MELQKKAGPAIGDWAWYRNVFESAHDAIFLETADGRIIDVNAAACRMLLYSREELLSMNVADILAADIVETVRGILEKKLVSGGQSFVGYNVRKDGKNIPVEVTINGFSWAGEQYLVVIARDVTDRLDAVKIRRQNGYLTSLHEVSLGLLNQLDIYDLLQSLVARAGELFGSSNAFICLLDIARGTMKTTVGTGRYINLIGHEFKMAKGVVGKSWQEGQPVVIENYQSWPERLPEPIFNAIQTGTAMPIKSGDQVIGVIGMDFFDLPRPFLEDERAVFGRFADLASLALVNASLHNSRVEAEKKLQQKVEEIRRRNEYLTMLHEVSIGLLNRLDLNDLLKNLVTRACELFGTSDGFICLLDESRGVMEKRIGVGRYAGFVGYPIKPGAGLTGRVWQTGQPMVVENYPEWEGRDPAPIYANAQTGTAIPLKSGKKVIGVIGVDFFDVPRSFSEDEMMMLGRFAELASIAIDNANLYTAIQLELNERKKTEEALIIKERELARLDRLNLVGEMAANLGHEIRNPLTTVRGFLQLMEKQSGPHRYISVMIDELDRANAIITEYLSMAKNKALDLKYINLGDVVQMIFPLLQANANTSGHCIHIDIGRTEAVLADEKEMRQMLLNLVRNGIEAMPAGGGVYIRTFSEEGEVVLAVRDEGEGIRPELLDKLGTPFISTKDTGTGLGLAVCYSIAARHKASISIDTGPGGTTFSVRFKVRQC